MTDFQKQNDEVLVELTLLGNDKAYEQLVIRHERAVKGTAYKVTGNEYSADDASQDAFVSAWMHLDDLHDRSKFGPWVCSIAKNCARNLRSHYKNAVPDISLHLIEYADLSDAEDNEISMLMSRYAEEEQNERLHSAVDELSEKIREVIKLHYFEEYSVAEIAEMLSLPAGTVKWRLSEGRRQLRKGYGIMEKTYNENEPIVRRVMRQVEELKLRGIKNNKSGVEDMYREVLANVEALPESAEKHHALADVLMRGYWWVPGEKSDEIFARIKESAVKGHNDDVMQSVVCKEHDKLSGQAKIDFMVNEQIPFLEREGYVQSLACVWFWLGYDYVLSNDNEKALEAFGRVTEILTPADTYYANAVSAKESLKRVTELPEGKNYFYSITGETYRYVDGKLCFWRQPGYRHHNVIPPYGPEYNASIFWNMHQCDSIIFDPEMKVGDVITASDGEITLTYKESGVTLTTAAGTFENCSRYVIEGNRYSLTFAETFICPGVGIVRQTTTRDSETDTWELSAYKLCGGEGAIPFAKGNRWEYVSVQTDATVLFDSQDSIFEVTHADDALVTLSHLQFAEGLRCKSEWLVCVNGIADKYCIPVNDGSDGYKLQNVDEQLIRAAELAVTKREKLHTKVMTSALHRIFETDVVYSPECTEVGCWNFFDSFDIVKESGDIKMNPRCNVYGVVWKYMQHHGSEVYKILHNFLYDIFGEATGYLWNGKWVPGYTETRDFMRGDDKLHLELEVLEDETVTTSAGTFENCRHLVTDLQGQPWGSSYRGGRVEYWFAPGVGMVMMSRPINPETPNVCELTEYDGVGDGYFPVGDGLRRKYAPTYIGDGFHASVEYFFIEDEDGITVYSDQAGTQDRDKFEKFKAIIDKKRQKKAAEKEKSGE